MGCIRATYETNPLSSRRVTERTRHAGQKDGWTKSQQLRSAAGNGKIAKSFVVNEIYMLEKNAIPIYHFSILNHI